MLTHHWWVRLVVVAGVLVTVLAYSASPAEAIPAFARKYQTSCQTCHIVFPKLNPFGEAFRLRGYRMPGETEEMIKEKPVSLGAPAYKRVWPDAVWPSDTPGTVPLSVNTVFSDVSTSPGGEGHATKNAFHFPEEVALLTGGTLGETLSFFGEVVFEPEVEDGNSEVSIEIEHSQINFNGPFGSGTAFNLKVGRVMAEITQPFSHGALLTTEGPTNILMFQPIGLNGGSEVGGEHGGGIALPHETDGLEAYGILRHRFMYSAGLSNGMGPGADSPDGNNAKDIFGRVAYKFGGLPLDGEGYTESDKNWREKSLRVGAFAYRGNGTGMFFPAMHEEEGEMGAGTDEMANRMLEDRNFTRAGFDVNFFFQDLNVIAGFVRGRDRLAEYEVEGGMRRLHTQGDFTYRTWFAEGDYVMFPWLHGALRYEWLDPANDSAPEFKRIVPNLTALVRANVKAYLEYQRNLDSSDAYMLVGGLRFGF